MNASYKDFHIKIIIEWTNKSLQIPPFDDVNINEKESSDLQEDDTECSDTLYAQRLQQLQTDPTQDNTKDIGQWLITTAVAKYAHIVPLIPRDLFWYFGGDCMHFLGDEEITSFQHLDEEFYSADPECNYFELRSKLLGLH